MVHWGTRNNKKRNNSSKQYQMSLANRSHLFKTLERLCFIRTHLYGLVWQLHKSYIKKTGIDKLGSGRKPLFFVMVWNLLTKALGKDFIQCFPCSSFNLRWKKKMNRIQTITKCLRDLMKYFVLIKCKIVGITNF